MAATIGSMRVTGSPEAMPTGDPGGTVTPDAGSNRKQCIIQIGEANSNPSPTITVDGDAPDQSGSIYLPISGTADIMIFAHIWKESTIAARSGHSISYSDGLVWSKQTWTEFTVQDTDQNSIQILTNTSAGAASIDVGTFSPNTDSNGIVVAAVVTDTANRAPMTYETGLTERVEYSVTDWAGGVADGSGGSALAADVTLGVSTLTSPLAGMVLFFPEVGGGSGATAYGRFHHEGLFL